MPKETLTVGDIKVIEEILERQKAAETDENAKAKIDEIIAKLDKMEIRS